MKDGMRKHAREACVLLVLLITGIVLGGCGLLDLLPPLLPDRAPDPVEVSLGAFENQVRVAWGVVERATTYKVFRSVTPTAGFVEVRTTSGLSFEDATVEQSRLYWYKVQACNATGCGPESAVVAGYAGYPPAPTNVQASDGAYPDKIVITWDPVPGATHYHVFRDRARDGTYDIIPGAENVLTNSFDDTTAAVGMRYWYRVKACNATRCGWPSEDRDSGCRNPCPPGGSLDAEG